MSVWVADLRVSPRVERKIMEKHSVTLHEVREAVLCGAADEVRRDPRKDGSVAFLARGTTATGRKLKIVIFAVDEVEGVFALGTAYPA